MGSVLNHSDVQNDASKAITILVTGFEPFQDKFPVNPSFEIARSLPKFLPAMETNPTPVQVVSYNQPFRVVYEHVRKVIPQMHDAYAGSVDLILHIGMASGRKSYYAERFAHRDGYIRNKDLDGKMPPPDEGRVSFADCPELMTTSLDYSEVLAGWRDNIERIPRDIPGACAETRSSTDAGRYLCDYIYFNSLAYFGRKSGVMDGGSASDRPVLFLHVPAESDGQMIEQGRNVAVALLRSMADSYARRQEMKRTSEIDMSVVEVR